MHDGTGSTTNFSGVHSSLGEIENGNRSTQSQRAVGPCRKVAAVRKFFENPALDSRYQEHNANVLEKYMYDWNVVINAESLQVAFDKLSEAGVLKLRSVPQQKYDVAAQGYTQAHQDVLDAWLKRNHLVHDPTDDRTFENCTAFYSAMRNRDFTPDNLNWCLQYLQGKGQKLHWLDRPTQNPWHDRAHKAVSPQDYRFAPKEDSNNNSLMSRHSHSSDPRFNGENDREKMKLMNKHLPDSSDAAVARMNAMWLNQARALRGNIHSETQRIQRVVEQTPGGPRKQYEAGKAEQKRIENERARGR